MNIHKSELKFLDNKMKKLLFYITLHHKIKRIHHLKTLYNISGEPILKEYAYRFNRCLVNLPLFLLLRPIE